jgi:Lrp/AsnC family leucine-responsive transcriptional regulator
MLVDSAGGPPKSAISRAVVAGIRFNAGMDAFDHHLLRILQVNNQTSYETLGEAVGLSATAVRRRVKRMRESGVIRADVALLDTSRVGITVITSIRFEKESTATYEAFKRRMKAAPAIAQCYTVTGDVDVVLIAHFPDLAAYEQWVADELLTDPAVARSTANVVYRTVKFETAIALPDGSTGGARR